MSAWLGELSGFSSLQHISAGRIPTLLYNERPGDGVKREIMNITFCRPGFRLWIWTFVLLTFGQLLSTCEPQFSQKIEIISSILTVAGKIQLRNISAREWGFKGRNCNGKWWRKNGCIFSEIYSQPMPLYGHVKEWHCHLFTRVSTRIQYLQEDSKQTIQQ